MKAAQAVDLIGLLCRLPRTNRQLQSLTGMHRETVEQWLDLLRGEGLVYLKSWERSPSGPSVPVYAWQPSLQPQIALQEDATK